MNSRFAYIPKVSNQSIVKIIPPKVSVHVRPDKNGYSDTVCFLLSGTYIEVHEVAKFPEVNVYWVRADCGWVMIADGSENPIGEIVLDRQEAENSWKQEKEKRQRMSSAVASMLIKSYSLPKAIRLARSIAKHATQFYPTATALTKVGALSMEDIMISLGGKTGLTKQQVFEYIKVAASRQSNPRQAVVEIAEDMFNLVTIRPSTWVTNNLNVIITEDVRIRNNKFIMCAAEGYAEGFLAYLQSPSPPELTCLHSDLHYTALHAAADFGKLNILQILINTGISLDIRDPVRGQTPLHFCAYSGRSEVASLLLAHGANRELTCNKGIYPYQAAFQQGHFECSDILKFHPPPVITMETTFTSIDSIAIIWQPPVIDPHHHAPIRYYHIECVYLEGSVDIPDPPSITTTQCHCTFRHLFPSCQYSIRIQTESMAGKSTWSTRLTAKTLPTIPDTPMPLEIHKVIINGMFVKWFAPKRCNGCPIDYYEVELIDEESKAAEAIPLGGAIEEDDGFDGLPNLTINTTSVDWEDEETSLHSPSTRSIGSRDSFSSTPSSPSKGSTKLSKRGSQKRLKQLLNSRSNTPMASAAKQHQAASKPSTSNTTPATPNSTASASAMKVSKLYRLLKHNNVNHLQKNILGLEPNRAYQLRIRAHNQMGYSFWSDWCPPVCPKMGVWMKEFVATECAITFTWFRPILSPPLVLTQGRKVEFYELQICRVLGPTVYTRSVKQYHIYHAAVKREEELAKTTLFYTPQTPTHQAHTKPDEDVNEYVTIDAQITSNEYTITGLKPGNRYKCRIRTKLSDENDYEDWEHGMYSEVVSLPPTRPDCPFYVRPQIKRNSYLFSSPPIIPKQDRLPVEDSTHSDTKLTLEDSCSVASSITDLNDHNIYQVKSTRKPSIESIKEDSGPKEPTEQELMERRIAQDLKAFLSPPQNEDTNPNHETNSEDSSSQTNSHNDDDEEVVGSVETFVNSATSSFAPPADRIGLHDDLDITHNSIVLTWTNGDANGQPITGYEIMCAHVRTYHIADVLHAREAFMQRNAGTQTQPSSSFEEEFHAKIYQNAAATTSSLLDKSPHLLSESTLEWKDVTTVGEFVSTQSFLVKGLSPGQAYTFKVRQLNAIGWSEYSAASPLISTYPSIPPNRPVVVQTKDTFAVLVWEEAREDGGPPLTTLEYEIHLRTLDATKVTQEAQGSDCFSSDWFPLPLMPRQLSHQELSQYISSSNSNIAFPSSCCGVMMQQLVECQWYVARVRIRTVIGWSPWSEASSSFRTLK